MRQETPTVEFVAAHASSAALGLRVFQAGWLVSLSLWPTNRSVLVENNIKITFNDTQVDTELLSLVFQVYDEIYFVSFDHWGEGGNMAGTKYRVSLLLSDVDPKESPGH